MNSKQPHLVHETWMPVGTADVDEIGKDKINAAIAGLEWFNLKNKMTLPFSQGVALQEIIKGYSLHATRIAMSNELSPAGLLAVESKHSNGTARTYFVDKGWQVTPVRSDFYPNVPEMGVIQ